MDMKVLCGVSTGGQDFVRVGEAAGLSYIEDVVLLTRRAGSMRSEIFVIEAPADIGSRGYRFALSWPSRLSLGARQRPRGDASYRVPRAPGCGSARRIHALSAQAIARGQVQAG